MWGKRWASLNTKRLLAIVTRIKSGRIGCTSGLETYPIPKRLAGQSTNKGEVPRRLSPIFRDREELEAAGSLSDKIEQGLQSSQNMVVLCSRRSAKSHWVNQEILRFKKIHPDGDIFPAVIDGEPFASNMPGREDEECFPKALRFEFDDEGSLTNTPAEPLAADLRKEGDGKRMGSLKLVSGMIGVGLDEIVQRDMQRGRKRVMAITGGSLAGMLVMATLTVFAISAREEAEARRNDAEGLIEFMLTDLRDKLEPVGTFGCARRLSAIVPFSIMTSKPSRICKMMRLAGDARVSLIISAKLMKSWARWMLLSSGGKVPMIPRRLF